MSFAVVGDIALHGLISSEPQLNNRRFEWLASQLGKCSGVFANLEVPIEGIERNRKKNAFLFSDATVTKSILKKLNVTCVSLANNHILDCGSDGLKNTIDALDEMGVYHTGAGYSEEHVSPVLFSVEGVRFGFAAYADNLTNTGAAAYSELFFNTFDTARIIDDIVRIRDKVDILIVSIHWGRDYSFYPEEWQVRAAKSLVDNGASVIMGHHSHTLQLFEEYNKRQIFYGLGSLTFGDFEKNGQRYALFRKTKNSAIFVLDDDCKITEMIPTYEKKGNFIVRGKTNILRRNERLTFANRVRSKNRLARYFVRFNEDVLYRVYEYFFGYYMNPLKRILQFRNIRKIKRLFK